MMQNDQSPSPVELKEQQAVVNTLWDEEDDQVPVPDRHNEQERKPNLIWQFVKLQSSVFAKKWTKHFYRLLFNSQTSCLIWVLVVCSLLLALPFIIFGLAPRNRYRRTYAVKHDCNVTSFRLESAANGSLDLTAEDPAGRVRGVWSLFIPSDNLTVPVAYFEPWPRIWDASRSQILHMASSEGNFHVNSTIRSCLVPKKNARNSYGFIDANHALSLSRASLTLGYSALGCLCASIVVCLFVTLMACLKEFKTKKSKIQQLKEEMEEEEAFRMMFDGTSESDSDWTTISDN